MEFFNKSKEEEEDEEEEEENPNLVCDFFLNSNSPNHQQWLEQAPNQNQFQNQQPLMDLSLRMDSNNNGAAVEREHMFDKVVTPSDVGKLNRLVIPKQHAEKYFPLDSTTNEKGLILNFEDRNGKPWRFRYSYWNSSQSYVMTKGWSRFVKDKKLDAGDIVSFHRGVGDSAKDRLFIDWCRRRPDVPRPHPLLLLPQSLRWASGHHFTPLPPPLLQPIRTHHHLGNYSNLYPNYAFEMSNFRPSISSSSSSSLYRMGNGVVVNNEGSSLGLNKAGSGSATAAKRLRLFGVNMECAATDGDQGGEEDLSNDGVSKRGKQPLSLNWDLL